MILKINLNSFRGSGGRVEYKGKVSKIIYQLQGGLRSSMGYIGAKNLNEINKKQNLLKLLKQDFMRAWSQCRNDSKNN